MKRESRAILVIADFPPPVQGISLVSLWVASFIKEKNKKTVVINTSAKLGSAYAIRRILKFCSALFQILKMRGDCTAYVALSHGSTLFFQLFLIYVCKLKRYRVIVHHHTFLPIRQPNLILNKICHGILRASVEHIFLSKLMQDEYQKVWHPREKTWVVTNHQVAWLRTQEIGRYEKAPGTNLCYSGRMSEEKGFWNAAKLARIVLTEFPEMTVTFLGPAANSDITNELIGLEHKFINRFKHVSSYQEQALTQTLQLSTFFIFPSQYANEASPLVVLEAQSLGNICLTSNVGTLATDVLPPGRAVPLDDWQEKTIELLMEFRINSLRIQESSKQIERISRELAAMALQQLEAVFIPW
jgi:glycosyltransferase involved in cell wall biosynthesis